MPQVVLPCWMGAHCSLLLLPTLFQKGLVKVPLRPALLLMVVISSLASVIRVRRCGRQLRHCVVSSATRLTYPLMSMAIDLSSRGDVQTARKFNIKSTVGDDKTRFKRNRSLTYTKARPLGASGKKWVEADSKDRDAADVSVALNSLTTGLSARNTLTALKQAFDWRLVSTDGDLKKYVAYVDQSTWASMLPLSDLAAADNGGLPSGEGAEPIAVEVGSANRTV